MPDATSTHTVTGATGFVGGALVLELLDKTDAEIVCPTRPAGDTAQAEARLRAALGRSCALYGRHDLLSAVEQRCRAVAFDLRAPTLQSARKLPGDLGEIWHSAASLRFKDEHRQGIHDHNVEGTRAMLELAVRGRATFFNYISTAYVAGRRTDRIIEQPARDAGVAQNAYEESKIRGETLVGDCDRLPTRILRPSIVIGHSGTHAAISSSGLYSFILGVRRVRKEVVSRKLGDFLAHRPLRVRGDAAASVNLIPVDVVARNAVGISRSDSDACVFHLVNATPPPVQGVSMVVFSELGMTAPRWVEDKAEFTLIDEKLDEEPRTEFFRSYLSSERVFDLSNTDAALGVGASEVPLHHAALRGYVRWYLDLLNEIHVEHEWRAGGGSRMAATNGDHGSRRCEQTKVRT